MKLSEVRIQNYKSIQNSGWVPIEDDITTLLGANESGKTSFLEAIRSFESADAYPEEVLCDKRDRTIEKHTLPVVELRYLLNGDEKDYLRRCFDFAELDDVIGLVKYADGSRLISEPEEVNLEFDLNEQIKPTIRKLADIKMEAEDFSEGHEEGIRENFAQTLVPALDKIIEKEHDSLDSFLEEFDEVTAIVDELPKNTKQSKQKRNKFSIRMEKEQSRLELVQTRANVISDLLPTMVYHSEMDTIRDNVSEYDINKEDHKTFTNLLKLVGIKNDKFQEMDDVEKTRLLDRAEGKIEGEVNNLWKQKEVSVELEYRNSQFFVLIKDERAESGDRVTRDLRQPSERSKGFQWFFSFYINLTATTEGEDDNTILLLDDPAVFLHPQGKRDWLEAIEQLTDNAQILYTSHSPFLIRKEFPSRIRLVRDVGIEGTKVTEKLHEGDQKSLEPLRKALGIGLGDSPFVSKRKILVEGVSDYYILTGLANYFKNYLDEDILKWSEVTIMPTNGGNQMIQAAKWVSSEEFSYAMVLDNDEKGKEVQQIVGERHHEIDDDRIILLEKEDGPHFHTEIEDMFLPTFYVSCVNEVYSEKFEDFEPLTVRETDDGWNIEDQEYEGRKIVSKINAVFKERKRGDLDKVLVANEIRRRLNENRDVKPDQVSEFKKILGKIRSVT